ncbi:ABC transporter ATP-binding protein [Cellulomonas triticagri]|uniref:ABC transporter ATP-binding protein n=1 Tax=Cellulomonas triticagri TaxID=2483352 RepID=A0A3M2JB56_9CELL|nr:ABC transporter ATP-binding protein [Cellulomonas triticagri]RMI09331.1 ABC transporter ATP-binding protein [Cellulomonas triticagri]
MIEAHHLHHAYGRRPVLRGVDLRAGQGEVVGLVGPNGSGKSTLVRALYGAITPDRGSVVLDGVPLGALRRREVARRVAVVVQDAAQELPLSVADVVELGTLPHRRPGRARDDRVVAQALRRVGVDHLADRMVGALSGGERQRVLVARALAQQTSHLLLDEPTNHLDIRYQHEVLALVRDLGLTTVVVLHDLNLAARYCDRLVLLREGRVHAAGPVADVLAVVPDVYGLRAQRVDADDGTRQLLFRRGDARTEPHGAAPGSTEGPG